MEGRVFTKAQSCSTLPFQLHLCPTCTIIYLIFSLSRLIFALKYIRIFKKESTLPPKCEIGIFYYKGNLINIMKTKYIHPHTTKNYLI